MQSQLRAEMIHLPATLSGCCRGDGSWQTLFYLPHRGISSGPRQW